MSEQKKVFMPDGYYMQDPDKQGWTFQETQNDRVSLDLIRRQEIIDSLQESIERCRTWLSDCSDAQDEKMQARAEQALFTFTECILRIKSIQPAQDCGKCKYRLAVIEAMRIGEICEKVKVVPVPKKATGKTGAIYILDDEGIIKGTEARK